MTRDELIEIMKDNLVVWYESEVIEGFEDAADAILAKLELERTELCEANDLMIQMDSEEDRYWNERQEFAA